jgi:Na+:H+ antiporter, NhaA family
VTAAAPPEVSPRAASVAQRLVTPIEAFLHVEAASGIVLLVAATAALIAANTSFATLYHAFVHAPVGVRVGSFAAEQPMHFLINDGLMTIFFFVVGLEIRREIHAGELSTPRRAALPVAAAVGGMITPALLYLVIVGPRSTDARGWGVPMATDIAFAVGVLALLGKRVPPALRVLLLALAIIDDIGSIVVIAIFYSGPLDGGGFAIALGGIVAIVGMQRIAIRRASLYLVPGIVVWFGLLRSGVHPTIAGVVVGLLTPARAWPEVEPVSPAERLQHMLHPWVAFVIMPVFAFANAGVTLDAGSVSLSRVALGIIVGLVLGKPLGIVAASLLAVRLRIALLPRSIGPRELVVVGIVAGIGFTMAIFVAALAFHSSSSGDSAKLDGAKAAILAASTLAILLSLVAGRFLCAVRASSSATASEAETSDDE